MKLSIIILNYNTRGLLRQCLKAIRANPPDFSYELIVVDNDSRDGSVAMVLQEFPDARTLKLSENLGYAGGNNRGLEVAEGEYLAILNPDVLVLPNAFSKLVNFLDANSDVGMVGPKLLNPDRTVQYSCYRFPTLLTPVFRRTVLGLFPVAKKHTREYLMADWNHDTTQDVDWLLGGALVIRRDAYEKVGLLDERFFLYFDDVDYARRMHAAGFRVVYLHEAEMIHFHQRESAGSLASLIAKKTTRIHVASAIKYFLKWRKASNNTRASATSKELDFRLKN